MSPQSDKYDIVNGQSGRPPGSVDVSENNNNVNKSKRKDDYDFSSIRDPTRESSSSQRRDPCPGTRTPGRSSTTVGGTPSSEPRSEPRTKQKRSKVKKKKLDKYVRFDSN